jgi:hypothetical protein
MILWFAGLSFALVWLVFRSAALDYRLVMLGSVLPVGEWFVGPALLHTLLASVALLMLVMLATRRRRLARRRLISLPIGLLMHLVLDGVWTRAEVFWWPFLGIELGAGELPELDRPVVVMVAMELVGLAALAWCWAQFGLGDPVRRRLFWRTGHLARGGARG